jgi:GTP cyclohydrolase II
MSEGDQQVIIGDPINLHNRHGNLSFHYVAVGRSEGVLVSSSRQSPSPILVRIQSSCLFSESLGAIDCDCADQLNSSLKLIARKGGYIIYLYEEGRGAGLKNKFKAILLEQRTGADTATVFTSLGMHPEPRDFSAAAKILIHVVGVEPVVLLTNNLSKIMWLKDAGVNVVASRPLIIVSNNHIARYLRTKARVLGHIIYLDEDTS